MGNTQTVGRKHHHKSHHTYTKKQGRHTTKGRHTKGNRRYRYYQRGGLGEGEAPAPAPAPAAAAPAPPAPPAEPAKCPPGCKPDTAFSVDAIKGNVAAQIQDFEEKLKNTQDETIKNAKATIDAKTTDAAVGVKQFINRLVPSSALAPPPAAAAAAGGGKRKRKTNKRRKHKHKKY
jgi:hypothetical protein